VVKEIITAAGFLVKNLIQSVSLEIKYFTWRIIPRPVAAPFNGMNPAP
jgi:hypothetical protein